jgi:hypothetical protein
MDNLIQAINAGKRRGYDESRSVHDVSYLFQYAIKKERDIYQTYFFSIDESKMDVVEDYGEEEINDFPDLQSALEYLIGKGADIDKLKPIKGVLPF